MCARYPDHVWHIDLTIVANGSGLWLPWPPFSQLQIWPFCWWVAVVVDQFTRRVVDLAVFRTQPDSLDIRLSLLKAFKRVGAIPRHLISDQGSQFRCPGFRRWCKQYGIRNRFGAVGRYGSIAIVERFIRTLKDEWTHRTMALAKTSMADHLWRYAIWYNRHRPHQGLKGKTPQEMADPKAPVIIRLEPRPNYPLSGEGIVRLTRPIRLNIASFRGEPRLPILKLKLAA